MKQLLSTVLYLSLAGVVCLSAQTPVVTLEAEQADLIQSPANVKTVAGFSGDRYVGGNDPGSCLYWHEVSVPEEGVYELRTWFNCSGGRSFTVKVNDFKEVECKVTGTAKWNVPPAESGSAFVYMNKGVNTLKIAPYPTTAGGPNYDKFEFYLSAQTMDKPASGFPMVLEAEYAQLYGALGVKEKTGFSNGKYVSGFENKKNSKMEFTCVNIPEEGSYELVLFTMNPEDLPLDIQINKYEKTYINVNKSEGGWEDPVMAETSVVVWMDKGLNTISFSVSGRDDGPNFDKIEIRETDEKIEKPGEMPPYPEACRSIDEFKISYMGSSVCWGQGAGQWGGYAYQHADLLKQRKEQGLSDNDWTTTNISIGGNTTQALLDRWERDLLPNCGRYVFYGLSLGNERNNGTPTAQAAKNYENGMLQLIKQARELDIIPVMANNYPNGSYNMDDYAILKNLNLLIHEWDVPSVNTLGAIDDGKGKWVKAYEDDGAHPNLNGHKEFFYAIVPSLFDALAAKKPQPAIVSGTSLTLGKAAGKHVEFVPENIVHPFTLSFEVKTTAADGTFASFENESGTGYLKLVDGKVVYESPAGGRIESLAPFKRDEWQRITLTHYYAWGQTILYVGASEVGRRAENLVPKKFYLGVADVPERVDFRQLFFWRSGMNREEIARVHEGRMMKSSLEIYAPLGGDCRLDNKAQSLNTITLVENEEAGVPVVSTGCLLSPNPVKRGEKVAVACSGDFEIYTLNGVLVDCQSLVADNALLSTAALTAGTYLVHQRVGNKTGRLIIY